MGSHIDVLIIGASQAGFIVQSNKGEYIANKVIVATGFQSDYSWIQIPNILNEIGKPVHNRGVSPIEGLYFLGLPWQFRRGSALIGWVGIDAEYITEQIL